MFMTNYELVYGKYKGASSGGPSPIKAAEVSDGPVREKGNGMENAAKAAKAVVGANVAAAKLAGGAISKLSKKAVDYAKSDDAAEKLNFAKEKTGAAFAGLKGKAAAFAAEHKKTDNGEAPVEAVSETTEYPDDIAEKAYIGESSRSVETDDHGYNENENHSSGVERAEDIPDIESCDERVEGIPDTESSDERVDNISDVGSSDEQVEVIDTESYDEPATVSNKPQEAIAERTAAPSPAPYTPPTPPLNAYIRKEEKKNPVIYVLIGIIAVLLLIVGVLGGMFLMKNKDSKNHENSSGLSDDTAISTEASQTASEANSDPEAATKPESATEAAITVSDAEIEAAAERVLEEFCAANPDAANIMYSLTDVNADGIPELFIQADFVADNYKEIYLFENDSFKYNGESNTVMICRAEKLIRCERYGGGAVVGIYKLENGQLNLYDELYVYAGQYNRLNEPITESEFNQLLSDYDSLDWEEPAYTPYTNNNSAVNRYGAYSGYPNIEKAPFDMVFYEGSDIKSGIVDTESTGLNMRSGPGSDYERLLEIPKGEPISILGMNNEWCYVKWSVYAAGARQDIDHYGFVSKQFVSIGDRPSSQITPVEKYGTIYSSDGSKVDGLSKSYLIDGGAESYIRHDLTHGWHIKAVNRYNDGSTDWYELYDADDGDYYGWVSQYHITFY